MESPNFIFMILSDSRTNRPTKTIMVNDFNVLTDELIGVCKYLLTTTFMYPAGSVCKVYCQCPGVTEFSFIMEVSL